MIQHFERKGIGLTGSRKKEADPEQGWMSAPGLSDVHHAGAPIAAVPVPV
jgi:hypothetical protein